ncbi:MAG: FAD-dependent monooxygenase, partial [Lentisphaeria bacterium]|nr:FAD-dependent monooxygenase [Lentisphaeria bacterium]
MFISLDQLVLPAARLSANADRELTPFIARACGIRAEDVLSYRIVKRSLDARKKPDVKILYRLEAEIADTARPQNVEKVEAFSQWNMPEYANPNHLDSPVVVGAGPAGLFAAYVLALAGARPVVLERGRDVEKRKADIDAFFASRNLNEESNFLYGEGGAGTWSDGKLYTRIKDERMAFVLQTFVACSAPENILYFSHPHLGSDRLPGIVSALRKKIIALGGSFRWECNVTGLVLKDGRCAGVKLADGETITAPAVLIACGHSARQLICNMTECGIPYKLKGFQLGMRIEHKQQFINRMQYGIAASYPALGAAEYSLSLSPQNGDPGTGAASFCMCPGGEIIPCTCTKGLLCTNGMSLYSRNGAFANSALITTVNGRSFRSVQEAFRMIEKVERAAFEAGGLDYTAPAQSAACFLDGERGHIIDETSYRLGRVPARLDLILPRSVTETLRTALRKFEKQMPGFVREGVFTGVETRVSSPVRFERDPERFSVP